MSLIYEADQTATGTAIVALGANGRIAVSNVFASTHLSIDVVGWYTASTGAWSYSYAADGLRSRTSGPGADTTFIWDRASELPMLLAESSTSAGMTYYIYGPDGFPVEQVNGDGTVVFLHHDQQGSTRMLTNTAGNVVATFSWDPYGRPAGRTGTADTRLGYAGQYTDRETGFQYLRARHYDPTTSQFLTRDPALALTRDAYGYAGRDPLGASDPSGLEARSRKDVLSNLSAALGIVAFTAGVAVLVVGTGGVAIPAAVTYGILAIEAVALGLGLAVTIDDCSDSVDGACLLGGAAVVAGLIGFGGGAVATRLARSVSLREFATPLEALTTGAFGAFGMVIGSPGAVRKAEDLNCD
jgi:RHS repeat-associated protein